MGVGHPVLMTPTVSAGKAGLTRRGLSPLLRWRNAAPVDYRPPIPTLDEKYCAMPLKPLAQVR